MTVLAGKLNMFSNTGGKLKFDFSSAKTKQCQLLAMARRRGRPRKCTSVARLVEETEKDEQKAKKLKEQQQEPKHTEPKTTVVTTEAAGKPGTLYHFILWQSMKNVFLLKIQLYLPELQEGKVRPNAYIHAQHTEQ